MVPEGERGLTPGRRRLSRPTSTAKAPGPETMQAIVTRLRELSRQSVMPANVVTLSQGDC